MASETDAFLAAGVAALALNTAVIATLRELHIITNGQAREILSAAQISVMEGMPDHQTAQQAAGLIDLVAQSLKRPPA